MLQSALTSLKAQPVAPWSLDVHAHRDHINELFHAALDAVPRKALVARKAYATPLILATAKQRTRHIRGSVRNKRRARASDRLRVFLIWRKLTQHLKADKAIQRASPLTIASPTFYQGIFADLAPTFQRLSQTAWDSRIAAMSHDQALLGLHVHQKANLRAS